MGQIPIGFRKQRDGVTNAELALARERAKLRETELEVSHQVDYAFSDMEANLVLTATNFNRRLASQRNVDANLAIYETSQNNLETLNILLNAQRSLAQAESDYFRSVTNYAKSISQVHYPQRIAAGVQRRLPDRRSLAGEGLLRCPPPCPLALGRPVPRLRFYLSAGPQPRAESAVLRPGHECRGTAGDRSGFGSGRAGQAAVGQRPGDAAGAAGPAIGLRSCGAIGAAAVRRESVAAAGRAAGARQPGFRHGRQTDRSSGARPLSRPEFPGSQGRRGGGRKAGRI